MGSPAPWGGRSGWAATGGCAGRWPGCGACPRLGFAARGRCGPSPGDGLREGGEREKSLLTIKLMTEGRCVQRLFRVTPPRGTRGPALAASTIPPLSVRPCDTRFINTQEGPNRCRSAPITDPLFRGFGIPNRSTASLVQRAGRDHPFPIFAGSPWRERDLARRVRRV